MSNNNNNNGASGTSQGGQLEERIDLSTETTTKIEQAQTLLSTSTSNLREALALLSALEKRCRVGNDTPSLIRVIETSIQLCKDAGDDEALLATLKHLSSRRSQKSKAVSALVGKAMPWVLKMDDDVDVDDKKGLYGPVEVSGEDEKVMREKLVVVLRDITDGKIFLEAERARLTRALATIKEEEGDVATAANVLQEVHVETYGSLSKREKIEFILEQMRLTLAKRDYVRAAIVSGKINRKAINEEGMEEEKIKFFTLLTEYHRQERDAFELAKDYYSVYLTSTVQKEEKRWREALESTVVFLALSGYSHEQQDMLNRVNVDPNLEKIESCRETIKLLLKKEIIHYPLPHQNELESLPAFTATTTTPSPSTPTSTTTTPTTNLTQHWHETFRIRIVQHNIRVAALYYKRIHGRRLAQLLNLEPAELESILSDMVSDGSVYAKMDRPKDVIRFQGRKTPEEVLSDWAGDVGMLLDLVESTTHLIHKENMTQ